MSPVERRNRGHAGRALVVAVVGVVVALVAAWGIALLAERGSVDVRLGDDLFDAGGTDSTARQIADQGPIPYPDVAGGDRDLVLQHLSDDPEEGWLALAARPPGTPRQCIVEWQDDEGVFRLLDDGEVTGACDGREYPPDGGHLPRYGVEIADDRILIDLWADERED